ncbi:MULTISPECIES: hypothetical protein [unclassified Mycobacterium]|uniref:hypothetical protein n=1 Tax=unclassified Mycobacterium TaxID=2642494 RepID=UPI000AD4AE16|nr:MULTISPECIES: hypothetical protein [unclassified Mycobacterium]
MATLPSWISQHPPRLAVVTPLKARACHALHAVLRSESPRPGVTLMRRGAERC